MVSTGYPNQFKPPGPFPFWGDNFYSSCKGDTPEQRDRYMSVLWLLWQRGGLVEKNAMEELCKDAWQPKRCGITFSYLVTYVTSKLSVVDDDNFQLLTHPKLWLEVQKARKRWDKSKNAVHVKRQKSQPGVGSDDQLGVQLPYPSKKERKKVSKEEGTKKEKNRSKKKKENSTGYRFEGTVVKLNSEDFESWENMFPTLNLEQELFGLDLYWQEQPPAKQKRWFTGTFHMLKKKFNNQTAAAPLKHDETKYREEIRNGEPHFIDIETGEAYIKTPFGSLVWINNGGL